MEKQNLQKLNEQLSSGLTLNVDYSANELFDFLSPEEDKFLQRIFKGSPAQEDVGDGDEFMKTLNGIGYDELVLGEEVMDDEQISQDEILKAIESLIEKGIVEFDPDWGELWVHVAELYKYKQKNIES